LEGVEGGVPAAYVITVKTADAGRGGIK
jgi:hypothetical protein